MNSAERLKKAYEMVPCRVRTPKQAATTLQHDDTSKCIINDSAPMTVFLKLSETISVGYTTLASLENLVWDKRPAARKEAAECERDGLEAIRHEAFNPTERIVIT